MWADSAINTNATVSGIKYFDLGNFEVDVWTDWVFHIFFSYKNNGVIQVWKNDKLMLNYSGPNYYNDQKGPYFKIGIYKSQWMLKKSRSIVNQRVFFVDDVKISNYRIP